MKTELFRKMLLMKSVLAAALVWGAACAAQEAPPLDEDENEDSELFVPRLPVTLSKKLFKEPSPETPLSDALNARLTGLSENGIGDAESVRTVLIESLIEGKAWHGEQALRKALLKRTARTDWTEPAALNALLFAAGCTELLELFRHARISSDGWKWLFSAKERIDLIATTVTDQDEGAGIARVIESLYNHDPEDRDRFFNLILAMAVVWDTPRVAMHHQIGKGWVPPDKDICLYYDYFKKLFCSDKTLVPYGELSVDSLVFVIDIPAPVSELEWALENVTGTRLAWGDHYEDIIYDHVRIMLDQMTWPHKEYTLQEIQECHGICVDQAYYTVLTARAHGIPSLYFRGTGKDAGHAWFGFMQKKDKWNLDVARYSDQRYATGFAIHPQTDKKLTDHELEYVCSQALNPEQAHHIRALANLARLLYEEDCGQGAQLAAQNTRQLNPLYEAAWKTECDVLVDTEQLEKAIALLKEQAAVFKKYPDLSAEARKRQADLLVRTGNAAEANKILGMEASSVFTKRDDLQQDLILSQANHLLEQGKARKGMELIERALLEQRKNGLKIYSLIVEYKRFAKKAGLKEDAEEFLNTH
ncbi:MAG: hypothetical protein MUC65_04040 [Pontiellaceae bacterium]|nr:hypothetical protein [Pontiellaceae bacterium]